MERVCREIRAPAMANLVEGGDTPLLPPARLEEIGFKIAAYPLTLLSAAARAMDDALASLAGGAAPAPGALLEFEVLRELVGFPDYDAESGRYSED